MWFVDLKLKLLPFGPSMGGQARSRRERSPIASRQAFESGLHGLSMTESLDKIRTENAGRIPRRGMRAVGESDGAERLLIHSPCTFTLLSSVSRNLHSSTGSVLPHSSLGRRLRSSIAHSCCGETIRARIAGARPYHQGSALVTYGGMGYHSTRFSVCGMTVYFCFWLFGNQPHQQSIGF